jgi:hypothetical protein
MLKTLLTLSILSFILLSCEKDEIAILPHQSGDATTNSVDMLADYRNQLYFDLKTNSIVGSNEKIEWDLAFESGSTGNHIFINTAKSMFIAKTNETFTSKTDTLGLDWKWETANGHIDSTAFEGWSVSDLFIVDFGYSYDGSHLGFGKLKIIELTATSWTIHYSSLTETLPQQITLSKNDSYNATFFTFTSGGSEVNIEPPKADWDICFTQYTHIFYGLENTPYLVSGVSLNRYQTEASEDFETDYLAINFESIINHPTSYIKDIIGYDWKFFDFAVSKYTIVPTLNFIIKSTEGLYYKLHFIDFYNETGEKGYPKFEFQQL